MLIFSRFITTGLAPFVDTLLVTGAPHIPVMNSAGCGRLQLNILVLQQNLKNVEANALLLRSTLYFDMFSSGPDSIITQAKENGRDLGFSYNEMKTLLELWYSEALASERREVAVAAKRGLEDHILQLSEFLW
jgi:exocyst complex component 4